MPECDWFCRPAPNPLTSPPAIRQLGSVRLQVQGCSFATSEPAIRLDMSLKHAIVTGNNDEGFKATNEIGKKAVIADNEENQKDK